MADTFTAKLNLRKPDFTEPNGADIREISANFDLLDEAVTLTGLQTLASKTLTAPVLTNPVLADPVISVGNLTFGSTAQRLTGDFSTTTLSNRPAVQSSVTNGTTGLGLLPNGSGTQAQLNLYNGSNPDAAGVGRLTMAASGLRLLTTFAGGGSDQPITIEPTGLAVAAKFHVSGGISFLDATDPGAANVRIGGALLVTGSLGLFGTAPTTKKTVTGSRAGNAALASLLTQLAAYGLLTDSSSA